MYAFLTVNSGQILIKLRNISYFTFYSMSQNITIKIRILSTKVQIIDKQNRRPPWKPFLETLMPSWTLFDKSEKNLFFT